MSSAGSHEPLPISSNVLPLMREMFPQELQLDWSMAEYLVGLKEQEDAPLAGLDRWRDDQQ